jgi:hypothetical protein
MVHGGYTTLSLWKEELERGCLFTSSPAGLDYTADLSTKRFELPGEY